MVKDESLELPGRVVELLEDRTCRVKLDDEREVLAHPADRMRDAGVETGDRVLVEVPAKAPRDRAEGRITYRFK